MCSIEYGLQTVTVPTKSYSYSFWCALGQRMKTKLSDNCVSSHQWRQCHFPMNSKVDYYQPLDEQYLGLLQELP